MTQEEIDQMIEDWVANGFPIELKRLLPEEDEGTRIVFNPVVEIGKLSYEEAKELMWECYHHQLTKDEYPLLSLADSPLDFFKKAAQLETGTGLCRQCGCKWDSPCIDEIHGACWWVDATETICSHCYYGWN